MPSLVVVDAGPLLATLDRRDPDHTACVKVLQRSDLHLVIPALVVAEVAYFASERFGSRSEAAFLRGLATLDVEMPAVDDWPVIADLVERYADLRLGTADAATVVLADRLETDLIVTLDRRHFGVVQSPKGRRFRLLPEGISIHEASVPYPEPGA